MSAKNILTLRNLSVVRGRQTVFSELSLSVPVGCNTAILGPNGAGKSTFLKLLTREIYPVAAEDSELTIFGEKLWNVRELRSRLGIVSNDLQHHFPEDALGRDVVLSGFFSTYGVWRDLSVSRGQRQLARNVMRMLEIETLAQREFGTFSTGEQRRFLLARALVNSPEALVLDVPSCGLDLKSAFRYLQKLRELMTAGTTVILVTHNLAEITPEFSRVILLKNGNVLADDTRERALTSARLSELFDFPLSVSEKNGFYSVVPAQP
ncbi:MAG: ATP-binding cassette domain-containing protein [Opitutales bacterium]|nr:ATP-binding cassette domain-containing protein [Opitutales bacterium]